MAVDVHVGEGPIAEELGDWAAGFALSESPMGSELLQKSKLAILDAIGLALGASEVEDGFSAKLRRVVGSFASRLDAQLLGVDMRAAPAFAALYNGALIHSCEFDDTSMERVMHVQASVVPAVLAIGEATDAHGAAVAEAFCVGSEVALRLAAGCPPPMGMLEVGFHNTSVLGIYGAGAAAAKLAAFSGEAIADVLSLCTSFASGTTAGWGQRSGRNKSLQPGWAAFGSLMSVNLVAEGVVCAHSTIDGITGLFASHLGGRHWMRDHILAGLGDDWKTLDLTFKLHPAGVMLQAELDATQQLVRQHSIEPGEIEAIEVVVPPQYHGLMERTHYFDIKHVVTEGYPLTHSWPYAIACTILHGQIELWHLRASVVGDRRMRELVEKMSFRLGDDSELLPEDQPAGIRIHTPRGKFYAERSHHGGYPNYLSVDKIVAKFEANAKLVLSASETERLRDLVLDIENYRARDIAAACRPGHGIRGSI